jgi:LCP family protein required for cell wall assembly
LTIIIGSVVAVISLGAFAIIQGISGYIDKIPTDDILGDIPAPAADEPMNFLVLGSDSRSGEEVQALDETGSRSDVIMIVHIKADLSGAFVASIPRDSYVEIPAGGDWGGGMNKINAALAYGGASLTAKTVYNIAQIPFSGAMLINFDGVQNMVAAVGGINACTAEPFESSFNHIWYDVGCHDLTPEEAEFWTRERYHLQGADLGRIQKQQEIIKGLLNKVKTTGVLTDPGKIDAFLNAVAGALTVDESMNLTDLAFKLKGMNPDNVQFATAPVLGTETIMIGGDEASIVNLDMPGTRDLFNAILNDTTDEWLAAHPQPEIATLP